MDDTRKTVGQGFDVPIRYKANLTIDEAVEYSGISRAGLLKMTNQYDCPFVLRLGHRRLIKRRAFDEYMSCVAVSVRGKVEEIGNERLDRLLNKNPYMLEIYPTEQSREALTVFRLYEGEGEWFDLSKKPIERLAFSVGGKNLTAHGYVITECCIGCKKCSTVCPQNCIDFEKTPAVIIKEHCLHCGNCFSVCPQKAIIKEG